MDYSSPYIFTRGLKDPKIDKCWGHPLSFFHARLNPRTGKHGSSHTTAQKTSAHDFPELPVLRCMPPAGVVHDVVRVPVTVGPAELVLPPPSFEPLRMYTCPFALMSALLKTPPLHSSASHHGCHKMRWIHSGDVPSPSMYLRQAMV